MNPKIAVHWACLSVFVLVLFCDRSHNSLGHVRQDDYQSIIGFWEANLRHDDQQKDNRFIEFIVDEKQLKGYYTQSGSKYPIQEASFAKHRLNFKVPDLRLTCFFAQSNPDEFVGSIDQYGDNGQKRTRWPRAFLTRKKKQ